jgi:UDPglucose 6-dehydrogenase
MAEKLDLGYDMFEMVMRAREVQAENMAKKLITLAQQHGLPVWIHGKAFKPNVHYIDGSYSLLVGHYVEKAGVELNYVDPLTGDYHDSIRGVVLMAHHAPTTYGNTTMQQAEKQDFYCNIEAGSVIVDPWRYLTHEAVNNHGCTLVQYGNTRIIQ